MTGMEEYSLGILRLHEFAKHRRRGFYDEPMRLVVADHEAQCFRFLALNGGGSDLDAEFNDEEEIRDCVEAALLRDHYYTGRLSSQEAEDVIGALIVLGRVYKKYPQTSLAWERQRVR